MIGRPNIAAHGDSGVLSAEGSRQGRMSSRLHGLMAEHGVVQEDFEHVGVEQSRVSRWCNPRKRETIPHHCVIALAQSEIPQLRALGIAILRESIADVGGFALAALPAASKSSRPLAAARLMREAAEVVSDVIEAGAKTSEAGEEWSSAERAKIAKNARDVIPAALELLAYAEQPECVPVASVVGLPAPRRMVPRRPA